jgi:hypothetical protein
LVDGLIEVLGMFSPKIPKYWYAATYLNEAEEVCLVDVLGTNIFSAMRILRDEVLEAEEVILRVSLLGTEKDFEASIDPDHIDFEMVSKLRDALFDEEKIIWSELTIK